MDVKSLHVQSVACPRMRTLVLQTMDFQSIVVDCGKKTPHGRTEPMLKDTNIVERAVTQHIGLVPT